MGEYINYIQENPTIALIGAGLLLILAGIVLRRVKILALLLVIISGLVFYFLLDANKVGKVDIEKVKKSVEKKMEDKLDVDKIKKSVKEKVMDKL